MEITFKKCWQQGKLQQPLKLSATHERNVHYPNYTTCKALDIDREREHLPEEFNFNIFERNPQYKCEQKIQNMHILL